MNTSLSRLRRAIEAATAGTISQIVNTTDNLLRIDDDLVQTDFEAFDAALRARRAAATPEERSTADQAVVDSYGGSLAEGMSTEWIENARAGIQRGALDAVASLARTIVADDPRRTLDLLEIARVFDPHNEHIYRDIMRLQARLGQPDGVSRTLSLLITRLAQLDDAPTAETVELARRLVSDGRLAPPHDQVTAPA
jgi:DNA-binding SARP family transcriptional activator